TGAVQGGRPAAWNPPGSHPPCSPPAGSPAGPPRPSAGPGRGSTPTRGERPHEPPGAAAGRPADRTGRRAEGNRPDGASGAPRRTRGMPKETGTAPPLGAAVGTGVYRPAMLDLSLLAAFAAAAFILCVTPGPDMMFIVAMGGRGGPATGVMAALGVAFSASVHAVAAMLGLSALFEALPALYYALRWAGAAYLLYLAYKAFRDRSDPLAAGGPDAAPAAPARMRAFWQGAVTNLLNPKVILFNVACLPQFVDPARGNLVGQL